VNPAHIFLNVPFDDRYQSLFLALVTGVVAHGATPRCVLEFRASETRLKRLRTLIHQCGVSFHDLSRVQVSRTPHGRWPRFNMPFELGLAVMSSPRHRFFLLEEKALRLQTTLSDLNGFDPLIHRGRHEVLLALMRDALQARGPGPTQEQLLGVHRRVARFVRADLRKSGAAFFSRASFSTITAVALAECRVAGLRG